MVTNNAPDLHRFVYQMINTSFTLKQVTALKFVKVQHHVSYYEFGIISSSEKYIQIITDFIGNSFIFQKMIIQQVYAGFLWDVFLELKVLCTLYLHNSKQRQSQSYLKSLIMLQ